jgi:diaminohydroxyphosphoribosylaminopyrimidine deaminase / 5-amino-6-(5-phosphoribosylamino)uracil reductase
VLVEGGIKLLQSFINEGMWDEIRIITNNKMNIGNGLAAPQFSGGILKEEIAISTDTISNWWNGQNI